MPKSVTFTSPRGLSMMLPGLMSRWITPCAWAASSARHTSIAMSIARSGRMRPPPARISASVRPSTYSITMKWTPSSEPVSNTETMCGCPMLAAACASRRNRITKPSSSANCGARTFTATVRPSTVSVPRKTLAMPPRPSSRSTRYRPPRVIGRSIFGTSRLIVLRSGAQSGLQDRPRDRRGDLSARRFAAKATAVEDDNRDGDPRSLRGREAHEPRVRILPVAVLGGAGLARHGDTGDLGRGAGPALHDADHHLREGRGVLRRQRLREFVGVELRDHASARVSGLGDQARLHLDAVVGDRRGDQGHLQGVRGHVLLPDRRDRDGGLTVHERLGRREHARGPRDVEGHEVLARLGGEPVRARLLGELLRAEFEPHPAEHDVARLAERVGERDLRATRTRRPAEVLDRRVGQREVELVRVGPQALRPEPVLERRRRAYELERRAGWKQLVAR